MFFHHDIIVSARYSGILSQNVSVCLSVFVCVVMVLIAVCLMKFGFGTNSIHAEDYVTVTVEGTNGQAVAEAFRKTVERDKKKD